MSKKKYYFNDYPNKVKLLFRRTYTPWIEWKQAPPKTDEEKNEIWEKNKIAWNNYEKYVPNINIVRSDVKKGKLGIGNKGCGKVTYNLLCKAIGIEPCIHTRKWKCKAWKFDPYTGEPINKN